MVNLKGYNWLLVQCRKIKKKAKKEASLVDMLQEPVSNQVRYERNGPACICTLQVLMVLK